PGGAHQEIVWTTEGVNVARALKRLGISVFVVKYRLAGEPGSTYSVERDETADVRRAMQWVRAHAGDYNIDPHRIGLMGFSAGGVHMYADTGHAFSLDESDRISILRWPDRLYDWLADSGFLDGRQSAR